MLEADTSNQVNGTCSADPVSGLRNRERRGHRTSRYAPINPHRHTADIRAERGVGARSIRTLADGLGLLRTEGRTLQQRARFCSGTSATSLTRYNVSHLSVPLHRFVRNKAYDPGLN